MLTKIFSNDSSQFACEVIAIFLPYFSSEEYYDEPDFSKSVPATVCGPDDVLCSSLELYVVLLDHINREKGAGIHFVILKTILISTLNRH